MKYNMLYKITLILLLFISFEPLIIGQSNFNNGKIIGRVFDQQQAVISGTIIIIKNLNNNNEVKIESNESGDYELTNLSVGEYEIKFDAIGFDKKIEKVTISQNSLIVVNVTLAIHHCDDDVIRLKNKEQLVNQFCEVHRIKLKKDIVKIIYGLFISPYDLEQEKTLFPYANKEYPGGCVGDCYSKAEVLFCSECRKAQNRFDKMLIKKNHK